MPAFSLRPAAPTKPIAGLIAQKAQVPALSAKLAGRSDLMLVRGENWLVVFSFQADVTLPWLPDRPLYLYAIAPGLLCQSRLEPDLPATVVPSLVRQLTSNGAVAITDGPRLWELGAALPVENCNLQALR